MVSSREELWQEWTGSRSERRQEELCRSAQSDLAHWQGQHPQRGTAKQQIELFGLLDPFDLLALSVFLVVALEELPFFFGGF